ncbi:MAG TPA: zinc ribbon domain-containing protein [Longimicrobiales bacterium]|nr:zinc ribbon domain-containing protein [Longimicrobiales bacterium]
MPVYDYECRKCGGEFQVVESIGAHEEHEQTAPKCPDCHSDDVRRILTGAFVKTGKKS